MKILILSVTAGQGHHQCAKALEEYFEAKGAECVTLDTLEYINQLLAESVAKGYLVSTQYSRTAYSKIYRIAEKKRPSSSHSISRMTPGLMAIKLRKYIMEYNPDAVICTHVFPAQIMTEMKNMTMPVIGIITDFTIHPYWENTNIDYYVLASEQLLLQAKKKNICESKALCFGIPIRRKFCQSIEKSKARAELGLEDKDTVLVMSGSMGFGNILKTVRRLDSIERDFQIVSVCGNNHKMKKHIDSLATRKKVYNYGYTDAINELMSAADCIITKPGGLTTSEALAKELPMIVMSTIPGQEDRNLEFLLNNGAAMYATKTFPVDECIYEMFTHGGRLSNMRQAAALIGKPNATADLCEFIMNLCKGNIEDEG